MKFFRIVLTASSAIALVALLAGCGTSTSPTAVTTTDSTPPTAPTQLSYTVDAAGVPTINWAASPGGSVTSYLVLVYSPSPDRDLSYFQIGETAGTSFPIPDQWQSGRHYFRVQAINSGGNSSPYSSILLVYLQGGGSGTGGGGGTGGKVE